MLEVVEAVEEEEEEEGEELGVGESDYNHGDVSL